MTPSEPLALHLQAVCKSFGGLRAVDGVELAVRPGERRALIGPNGAGKTTLFNLIAGALPVSSGAHHALRHRRDGARRHTGAPHWAWPARFRSPTSSPP